MLRARLERAIAAIYNQQDVPVYWLEFAAFTGPAEALYFDPFDSFEAVEKAGAILGPLYEAHPELLRMRAGIEDTLSSERRVLAVRRDSPDVGNMNLAQAHFLRMLIVRSAPGEELPLTSDLTPCVVYEVTSGMPSPTLLIFQALTAFTDLPAASFARGTVVEDSVYAVDPELSHVSHKFAEQNQAFWMRP